MTNPISDKGLIFKICFLKITLTTQKQKDNPIKKY